MCGLQVRRWGLVFRLCRGGRIHFPPHFSLRSWEGKNVGCLLTLEKNPDDCFSAHLLPNGENAGNSEEMSSSSVRRCRCGLLSQELRSLMVELCELQLKVKDLATALTSISFPHTLWKWEEYLKVISQLCPKECFMFPVWSLRKKPA